MSKDRSEGVQHDSKGATAVSRLLHVSNEHVFSMCGGSPLSSIALSHWRAEAWLKRTCLNLHKTTLIGQCFSHKIPKIPGVSTSAECVGPGSHQADTEEVFHVLSFA